MTKEMTPHEASSVENFYYPPWLRMLSGCSWVLFTLYVASIFCLLVISIGFSPELDFDALKSTIPRFGLMTLIATAMIVGVTAVAIQQPNIRTQNGGFQLFTPLYQSKWLGWDAIKKIQKRQSSSTKRHHTYAVILKGTEISPLYSLLTFTWVLDGYRAFILTNKIGGYDRFIALMREKRPDLFIE